MKDDYFDATALLHKTIQDHQRRQHLNNLQVLGDSGKAVSKKRPFCFYPVTAHFQT